MDKRQQKTRKLIISSFLELLSYKSYSKITVQDIIDKANIGRSTFYDHFETKDSLLDSICQDLFNHSFHDHLEKESNHDFSSNPPNLENQIKHILIHIKNDKDYLGKILLSDSSDRFYSHLNDAFISLIKDKYLVVDLIVPLDYASKIVSGIIINSINWWVKTNYKQDVNEVSSYIYNICSKIIFYK